MRKLMVMLVLVAAAAVGQTMTATIAANAATSSELQIGPQFTLTRQMTAVALVMPSAWTAADLVLEASLDGTTWLPVYDADGGRVRVKVDVSRVVVLDASVMWALPRLRFRSVAVGGTTDVVQAAARTLQIVMR